MVGSKATYAERMAAVEQIMHGVAAEFGPQIAKAIRDRMEAHPALNGDGADRDEMYLPENHGPRTVTGIGGPMPTGCGRCDQSVTERTFRLVLGKLRLHRDTK